jgi:sulfotransferase family protein
VPDAAMPTHGRIDLGTTTPPLLVTGMHRSGTTWVGTMLCAAGDFVNIGEPLNAANRQTIFPRRVARWYTHIDESNEGEYLAYYRDSIAFRPHPFDDVRRMRLGSPRDPIRVLKRWAAYLLGRAQHRRLLIKDPFAVFSIEWFARRLGCQVVVVVRHPVAVVSSLKRLGYTFDFHDLLQQPSLMSERLDAFRQEMEALAAKPEDVVGQGSLLWRIIYGDLASREKVEATPCVVRHEDLSREPLERYASLYEALGLQLTPSARSAIEASTRKGNRAEVTRRNPFDVRLDSRANLGNWKKRLDPGETARILELTEPVLSRYYPEGLAAVAPEARSA